MNTEADKTQKRSHENNAQPIPNIQIQETKPVFKRQRAISFTTIPDEGRSNGIIPKPDKTLVIKNKSRNYNSLNAIAMQHKEFCQKQIATAMSDQDCIAEEIKIVHPDFHHICLNLSKQIGSDITFLALIQSHLNNLIIILDSTNFVFEDLSEPCSLLVLELYKKIEYLKTALKTAKTTFYDKTPKDYLHALYIIDANDILRDKKYNQAIENIKTLLEIQNKYLNYISFNCIASPQTCYLLGYISLHHQENWCAVGYFKRGLSLYPTLNNDYYQYLVTLLSLLKVNKCDQQNDSSLTLFFNWVETTYNAYLNDNNNLLDAEDSNSLDSET